MVRIAAVALLASVSALGLAACSGSEPAAKLVGAQVDNFMLVDQTGMGNILRYDTHTPAVVLASYVNGDKTSQEAAKALQALKDKNPDLVIQLINSSETDTRETIADEAKAQNISLPILDDEFQLISSSIGKDGQANPIGFTYTGEAVIVSPKDWKVVYHGPVSGVEAALAEFTAGKPVTNAEMAVSGTKLVYADAGKQAEWTKISYVNDVAPIMKDKCVDCHQPNGIAPEMLYWTSYNQVKTFAPMIREAIRTDRMPPFDADTHYRAFENNENLTAGEIKTLVRWIDAGAPSDLAEGATDPLTVAAAGREDWPLGKPDLIVDIPSYDVPAAGVVDYQMPVVANPMKEGRWLKATTFKAGNRQGVHHILAGWMEKMPKGGRGFDWNVSMGGYAVGAESQMAPDKWATWIPAGGAISFQMHYTPIGKAFTDNSKIAFYWSKEDPELMKRQIIIADPSIEIAPNQARHHETAYVQFPADVQIYAAQVHAHYRGYASKLTAEYPDGKTEVLLNMPHYDFNWQREYIFEDLIDLPAGTKLIADYWYDNSVNNKALGLPNAKDLTNAGSEVVWGDQSYEEMLFTGIQFRWKDETAKAPRNDLQGQLEQTLILTMADDNRDGKLQETELRLKGSEDGIGDMHQAFKANFAQIDADKDAGLSMQELGAALEQMAKQAQAQGQRGPARSPT
jgi:mono/diheme cytochrome c family protein